ncbi:MAG: hypothetical protein MZU97_21575 [Bacillus subtilis]|nr:hypothetical protein [Bacillus subtilis]
MAPLSPTCGGGWKQIAHPSGADVESENRAEQVSKMKRRREQHREQRQGRSPGQYKDYFDSRRRLAKKQRGPVWLFHRLCLRAFSKATTH